MLPVRCLFQKPGLVVGSLLAIHMALAGCNPPAPGPDDGGTGTELGEADVTYPGTDGVLMQVVEPGEVGTATYLGTPSADGQSVALTGFEFDTGDGKITVTLDASQRPIEIVKGTLRSVITWNPDGSCQWTLYTNGSPVGQGSGRPEGDATRAKSITHADRGVTKEAILACTINSLEWFGQLRHGNALLAECLQVDDQMRELVQGHCVLELVLQARLERVREQYERIPGGGPYYAAVHDAVIASQHKLSLLYVLMAMQRVDEVAQQPGCGSVPTPNVRLIIRNTTNERVTASVTVRAPEGGEPIPLWQTEIAADEDAMHEYPSQTWVEQIVVRGQSIVTWRHGEFEIPAAGFVYDFATTQDCNDAILEVVNHTSLWIRLHYPATGMTVGLYSPGDTAELLEEAGKPVNVLAYGFTQDIPGMSNDDAATCWGPRQITVSCQGAVWNIEGSGGECPK